MKKDIFRRFLKGGISLITGPIKQNIDSKDGGVGKVDKIGLFGILSVVAVTGLIVLVAMGKIEASVFVELVKAIF